MPDDIPVDDNDRPIDEGDRPIITDDMFEDGICFFPGPDADMPSALRIGPPVEFLNFVKDVLVLDNSTEEGFKRVPYTYPNQPPENVLGLNLNRGAINMLQKKYVGRAFLLQAPNKTGQWMTLEEWTEVFETDGLDILARMRWEWFTKGGGVGTPGQRVTGLGQHGIARPGKKEFKRLGKY